MAQYVSISWYKVMCVKIKDFIQIEARLSALITITTTAAAGGATKTTDATAITITTSNLMVCLI